MKKTTAGKMPKTNSFNKHNISNAINKHNSPSQKNGNTHTLNSSLPTKFKSKTATSVDDKKVNLPTFLLIMLYRVHHP